ncbi:MAG: HYR domain-containing protein [Proteobacteria bacterium]|nr:HYR domain-containing protein [Pseudomonadota bacterium]
MTLSVVGGGSKTWSVGNLASGTLNGTNSHIFFGNSAIGTTFSDFVVSPIGPGPIPAGMVTLFEDAFSGSTINSGLWGTPLIPGGSSLTVANEAVSFASQGSTGFPYIDSVPNPFPTSGDFVFETVVQYSEITSRGDGMAMGSQTAGIFSLWADTIAPTLGTLRIDLLGAPYAPANDKDCHTYRLEYISGSYSVFVDGTKVLGPTASALVPTTLWIGHPPVGIFGNWSDFKVEYVRVVGAPSNQPPTANAGTDQTVECANPSGTPVALDGSGSNDPNNDTLSYTWTGTSISATGPQPTVTLGKGIHTITLTVSDGTASDTDEVVITIQDTTPPVLTIPGNIVVECSAPGGQVVTIGQATATDNCDANPSVSSNAPTMFSLGTTVVTWTAKDDDGNEITGDQSVTVQDTTPPALTVPGDIVVECSVPGGQVVTIGQATATDNCDTNPSVSSNAPTMFSLGTTVVTWTAKDATGNEVTGDQNVTVTDTTPPVLTIPGDVVVECSAPGGQVVTIGQATATDNCDANPSVSSNAPAMFSLGTTVVTWTAVDATGNSISGEQSVTIVDITPPVITLNVTTTTLWPVNHKLVSVGTGSVSDMCAEIGASLSISGVVTSNQPINGLGDGNTDTDWQFQDNGDGTFAILLRAERSGNEGERIYTVKITANDGNGNTTTVMFDVNVPHDQAKGSKKAKKPAVLTQTADVGPVPFVGPSRVVTAEGAGVAYQIGESRQIATVNVDRISVQQSESVVISIQDQLVGKDLAGAADLMPEVHGALSSSEATSFGLRQNFPNPFNPETMIGYSLSEASEVRLVIYNLLGQTVRVLVNESQSAGRYQMRWDGRDASGHQVTSGVYLYRLTAGSYEVVKKMILTK